MRGRRRHDPIHIPIVTGDPEGIAALTAAYLESLRVKNFSEHTVEDRLRQLRYFTTWCADRGLTRPGEITRPILERYQGWLFHYRKADGKPLTFHSQEQRLLSVRAFFKYLARNNHVLSNPAADLELPRLGQRLPREALTPQEAEAVLRQPDVTKPLGLRDRAVLETFYSTGMRRMELAGLLLYDLDPERGTVLIRLGKGKKDRMVPIGERALAWISKYKADVRESLVVAPDPGFLFLNELGESLGTSWLTIMVRRYVERAGVGKRGSCHLFRHTLATLMLEGGADVRYIQEMLGHARLDTTQVYTRVSIRTLKAIHDATHPAAKLKRREGTDSTNEIAKTVLHARPDAAAADDDAGQDLLVALESEAEVDDEDLPS